MARIDRSVGARGRQPPQVSRHTMATAAKALLLPDKSTHTRLVLQPEALETLRQLDGPVALVSVVGAYRTGKSWLLNELMKSGCDGGFIVGHERHTQTKGVWIQPSAANRTAGSTHIVYMDTEGFEGTGQAEVYDDRIFAFAALVSSVLVYNLAETIKQADIERLAFAATLSAEFWKRSLPKRGGAGAVAGDAASSSEASAGSTEWTPPALLWLVQRDFLQGGSVESYLHSALAPTAGSTDEHAVRLNKVREALHSFGRMRAMGLVQPHVRRTQLCDLPRSAFDPEYLRGADRVRAFVAEHAHSRRRPLSSGGSSMAAKLKSSFGSLGGGVDAALGGDRALETDAAIPFLGRTDPRSGASLAALITRLVEALNAHEIPTAGSVVEAFNSRLTHSALETLQKALRSLLLPIPQSELEAAHLRLLTAAERTLEEQSFGASEPAQLASGARDTLRAMSDANFVASQRVCDAAWATCQASVRGGRGAWLPSTSRFTARVAGCNSTLSTCIGPAAARFHEVLLPALTAEATADYAASYREKMHRALVLAAIFGVVGSRFFLKSTVLETLCAIAFVCLEIVPAIIPFGAAFSWLGPSPTLQRCVDIYEALVYNPIWDLNTLLPLLAVVTALALLGKRCLRTRTALKSRPQRLRSWGSSKAKRVGSSTADDGSEVPYDCDLLEDIVVSKEA